MATHEEKIQALTKLMQDGILTAEEFGLVVAALEGKVSDTPAKEKSPLEKKYDEVFADHIISVFKSPSACKWPELSSDMIKKETMKIDMVDTECTFIETYIDAPNSYGTMLRQKIRLVMDDDGNITRALQEAKTGGVGILSALIDAANKDNWMDIVKL